MTPRHLYAYSPKSARGGFTLIETLVAITLLTTAIVAPIALTVQSLQAAFYARDQITAFYLAQEAIEAVRSLRDGQILTISQTANASGINIFGPIPVNTSFRIDARKSEAAQAITGCSVDGGTCIPLKTDGTFYGYESGWTSTNFTRTLLACYLQNDGTCTATESNEMRVTATVSWKTGAFQSRSFSISEDMYRWVEDGSGAH